MRNRGAALALAATLALPNASIADGSDGEARWLRLAVERLCPQPGLSGLDAQDAIPGSWLLDETRRPDDRDPRRIAVRLLLPGADRLTVERRQFRGRLRQFRVSYAVRDGEGKPLGYDYWDLDPWPYDGDVSRGPFLPIRHGTAVASILAREAPDAALVPFRYPRPDMSRMGELVARAVQTGVRILAMPLGSRKPEDWRAFERAFRGRDILAIVSAGNDGRDIDREPVYPAALELENIVTVTSADAFGRLASGSNWGAETVDVMLPAENLEIVDFRGASGKASGSSYAVPRLAALAARILARHPGLGAAELKARILARATPSPFERKDVVSAGWISDPLSD